MMGGGSMEEAKESMKRHENKIENKKKEVSNCKCGSNDWYGRPVKVAPAIVQVAHYFFMIETF